MTIGSSTIVTVVVCTLPITQKGAPLGYVYSFGSDYPRHTCFGGCSWDFSESCVSVHSDGQTSREVGLLCPGGSFLWLPGRIVGTGQGCHMGDQAG
jgi:hypothetical protein